ncbi:STAS domain-containing protein [Paenibacillus sp. UMB4589-SE434]|uniref:STAS domain-containing protein n=1 Tax=Paenibacillus sp. UMB4589-SE434 TaxID=3046314 RepID=UPI00254FB6F3|nr:STAS domain-containing protein [Paenibacillus sp. UMB4589-SE434]MDK8183188.1 STAS domain-containing protein [Paenibacillus sp. UMB4589-SE434]
MSTNQFAVVTHQDGQQITIQLQGDLDLAASGEFRSFMEPLANDSTNQLTLDLSKLTYIDSTGIGILISIVKVRKAAGAPFFVENVPSQVQKLFDMTGISKFLTSSQ